MRIGSVLRAPWTDFDNFWCVEKLCISTLSDYIFWGFLLTQHFIKLLTRWSRSDFRTHFGLFPYIQGSIHVFISGIHQQFTLYTDANEFCTLVSDCESFESDVYLWNLTDWIRILKILQVDLTQWGTGVLTGGKLRFWKTSGKLRVSGSYDEKITFPSGN